MKTLFDHYRNSFRGLPPKAWALASVLLVNRSGSMVMVFLTLYLTTQQDWTEWQASFAIAIYGVGSCIGTYSGGRLAERYGASVVQLGSLLGNALGYTCLAFATQTWSILALLLFTSAFAESFRPANAMAISMACPVSDHARAFSLNRLAVNLGFTLGPAIGGVLAGHQYLLLFILDALSCLAAAMVLVRFAWIDVPSSCGEPNPANEADETTLGRLDGPSYARFLALMFLMAIVFLQLLSTYPLALKNQYGLTERGVGLFMAMNTILVVALEMPLTTWLQRYASNHVIACGALLVCFGFGGLVVDGYWPWLFVVVLLWSLGEIIAMPFVFAFITETSEPEERPRRLANHATVMAVAFVSAPIIGSSVNQLHPRGIWWCAIALGPPLAFLLVRMERSLPVHVLVRQPDGAAHP